MEKIKNDNRYIGSGYLKLTQPYRFIVTIPIEECISRLDSWSTVRKIREIKPYTIYDYRIYATWALGISVSGRTEALDEDTTILEGSGIISFTLLLIMVAFIVLPYIAIEDATARVIAPLCLALLMSFFWIALLGLRQNMILELEKLLISKQKNS